MGEVSERNRCLEQMETALQSAGYDVARNVVVGDLFGIKSQKVHMRATNHVGAQSFVTLIGQVGSGSTTEKIPFKVIQLADIARRTNPNDRFYVVLYGRELDLYDFYVNGGLSEYVIGAENVGVLRHDRFVELANQGRL